MAKISQSIASSAQSRNTLHGVEPSLLARQATGGEIADKGLTFQNDYVAIRGVSLLANAGFESLTQESIGDTEFRVFSPHRGSRIYFAQVKNKRLSLQEFWKVIREFRFLEQGSLNQYAGFTLVATNLSDQVRTIVRALYRIRQPMSFYGLSSAVADSSLDNFTKLVISHKGTHQDAEFLFRAVDVEDDVAAIAASPELVFYKALTSLGSDCQQTNLSSAQAAFVNLSHQLRRQKNQAVSRQDILASLRLALPDTPCLHPTEISVHTAADANDLSEANSLRFDWQEFSGNDKREFPRPAVWREKLWEPLVNTRRHILTNHEVRRIRLTGTRRLSAAVALGCAFNAVSGFSISMRHRESQWHTDAHPTAATPNYEFEEEKRVGSGDDLVVGIGIGRDVRADVQQASNGLGLSGTSALMLYSTQPIESSQQANLAVTKVKQQISRSLNGTNRRIHLFYAGPSHVALFIGHRLNAMGQIQCYEWTAPGKYVSTCTLS